MYRYKINKQLYLPIYIVVLLLVALYINNIITTDNVEVRQKEEEKTVEKINDVTIAIKVQDTNIYQLTLKETETVMDAINKLREDDNKGFTFEKTSYSDNIAIDLVNNQRAPSGYSWRVFLGTEDITSKIEDLKLKNQSVYEFKLIRI